jgi:arylsulfatase A-like enzyme
MKPKRTLATFPLRAGLALAFAAFAACTNPGPPAPGTEASTKRPNVLIILADDLGYSDIGAFGGEIPTPSLDELARQSRLLTSHYVSPTCSPSRAMLLSGTDHHLAGMGSMAELINSTPALQGSDGYEGYLHERVLWLPQLLQDAGYHTTMAGKWHLGTREGKSWPNARGFETSYALLPGAGHHFAPVPGKPVPADQGPYVENGQPAQVPTNFYSSDFYTDKIISNLERTKGDGKPFFAYLAYTAPHWPLQAPDADIARFAGRYDSGYEAIRTQRLAKQRALGILPADFKPYGTLPASKEFPRWEQLTPEQRKSEAKKMEVYAAMVSNMDRNIGRLLQYLKSTGQYDNTLIVFMSDNGAEATPSFFPNNANNDNSIANMGRPLSNIAYGPRWAEVSATPLRYFKGYTSEGGISAPAIVRMPGQTTKLPTMTAATHITDVAPTIVELAGVRMPSGQYAGRKVVPMTGMSLLTALGQSEAPTELANRTLNGELFAGRYTRNAQWKLVSIRTPLSDNTWELYDIAGDRGETRNLASERPAIVQQLSSEWERYAKSVGVVMVSSPMPNIFFGAEGSGLVRPEQPRPQTPR